MKNKGFCLLEIIVVLAIIGILLALTLNVISEVNDRIDNFEEIKESCKMYENSTIDRIPVKCFKYFKINSIIN